MRKREEGGCALRSSKRKASMSFSDRSRLPPFLLFFPLTTRIFRCIKSDVYREGGRMNDEQRKEVDISSRMDTALQA
ncbi:hypothetical protein AM501_27650 [Aneurinibacillus migulanus]|nr:hypothetical protein TS64_20230 [Aneurinibacillus migulanus]KPD05128.1 hypothetical protein AM501_27650 [Aneurinibacillus migulanus]